MNHKLKYKNKSVPFAIIRIKGATKELTLTKTSN